jgi:serine/threonine-protein kinase RIO1
VIGLWLVGGVVHGCCVAEDFALAMQLQEGEKLSGVAAHKAVSLLGVPPTSEQRVYGADDWEDAMRDAGDSGAGDDDVEVTEDEEVFHASRGTVWKHDKHINGRYNVHQLEKAFGAQTGDLSDVRGAGGDRLELSNRVATSLRQTLGKTTTKGVRSTGRVEASVTATREGVLDQRTSLILFKLVTAGALGRVSGVLRSGKEASVLHGTEWAKDMLEDTSPWKADLSEDIVSVAGTDDVDEPAADADDADATAFATGIVDLTGRVGPRPAGEASGTKVDDDAEEDAELQEEDADGLPDVAIKVFRTTLNEFSNRFDYLDGDRRYRHAKHSKQNPRKLVKLWGRKEFANLYRLYQAGLPCPQPRLHRDHVLVMDFLGDEGWPAPQLHEATIKKRRTWTKAYEQTVSIMHGMWHCARLVHADLSEYNLLWHKKRVFVIDVGQAVELNHPDVERLLLADCTNITRFFRKQGVPTLEPAALAELVKDDSLISVFRPRRPLEVRLAAAAVEAGAATEGTRLASDSDPVTAALREQLHSA